MKKTQKNIIALRRKATSKPFAGLCKKVCGDKPLLGDDFFCLMQAA